MEVTWTRQDWGYWGCCCAVLSLTACPLLLGDDFLLSHDAQSPDAGALSAAGAGGEGGSGRASSAGTAGVVSAGSAGAAPAGAGSGGSAGQAGASGVEQTCNDGIRNQDESGVDCGGLACSPCDCQFGPFHDVVQVDGLGADDRWGPMLSADGTTLYYSTQPGGVGEDIFRATRSGTGTAFADAQALANVNGSTLDGSPFLSHDDRTLFFFSDRAGGVGSRDLWMATRPSPGDDFSAPQLLVGINSSAMDLLPRLSRDGLTLLFESTRSGGKGGSDIWAAERSVPTGPFAAPHLRADLSTDSRDEGFSLSGDQLTLVISSNRGGDGMDLWLAKRSDPHGDFAPAVAIEELNGSTDELDPGLSANGREIFFTSNRDGDARIYHAVRDCQ